MMRAGQSSTEAPGLAWRHWLVLGLLALGGLALVARAVYLQVIDQDFLEKKGDARILREAGYTGELRAAGDVLVDQIPLMRRCGFDSFALRADQDPQAAHAAFRDFSVRYQAATDEPLPLFRRRAERVAA